jgi:hypothetical protein
MKKIMIIFAALFLSAAIVSADNRAIDASKLPAEAKAFMEKNFPGEQILYATQEDDLFLPDYDVALANGVLLEFYNNGSLEKIACRTGISLDLIPVPTIEFIKVRYPDAFFVEYKVDKREFEVTLSNRMELKFNKNYNLIGIDD